jgi:dTDP-4-amino-4,6-dideoxygalactose transaminase
MEVPFVDLSRIHTPIRKELDRAIASVLDSNSFILGKEVEQFEKEFSFHEGAKFGVGLANGSDALVISLKSCGVGKGDEVITHRVINKIAHADGVVYQVKGDANTVVDLELVRENEIKGKAITVIPLFGYFIYFLKTIPGFFLFIALPTFTFILFEGLAIKKVIEEEAIRKFQKQLELQ